MSAWVDADALATLRGLLADGTADKYEYRSLCHPAPDGITRIFFTGQTRLVTDTLKVYVDSVERTVTPTLPTGTFEVSGTTPSPSGAVEASFYYQWFTDDELRMFLAAGANSLSFEAFDDESLAIGLRPVVVDLALYYAYMRKAAEYADSITASAAGYTADQSKSYPNWKQLADQARTAAEAKLKIYTDQALVISRPVIRFVAYGLPRYVP